MVEDKLRSWGAIIKMQHNPPPNYVADTLLTGFAIFGFFTRELSIEQKRNLALSLFRNELPLESRAMHDQDVEVWVRATSLIEAAGLATSARAFLDEQLQAVGKLWKQTEALISVYEDRIEIIKDI